MQRNKIAGVPVRAVSTWVSFLTQLALKPSKYLRSPLRPNLQNQVQRRIVQEFRNGLLAPQQDFPDRCILPEKYGRGLPERVVELLLAKAVYVTNGKLLDVGHANAMPCHLHLIKSLPHPRNITGIDIAHPVYNVKEYYQESVCGDITETGFAAERFDSIWCISALEHFGMDNSGYNGATEIAENMDALALKEMLRILKKDGALLITVPYGKFENHGWFRNYDARHWEELLSIVRSHTTIKEFYFRHTHGGGWAVVSPEELRYVGYYDQANSGAGGLAAACIVETPSVLPQA